MTLSRYHKHRAGFLKSCGTYALQAVCTESMNLSYSYKWNAFIMMWTRCALFTWFQCLTDPLEQNCSEPADAQQQILVVRTHAFWGKTKYIWVCHPGLLHCPSHCYNRNPTRARRALINMSLLCSPELTTSHFPLTATQITGSCCFPYEKHGFWKAYSLSGC